MASMMANSALVFDPIGFDFLLFRTGMAALSGLTFVAFTRGCVRRLCCKGRRSDNRESSRPPGRRRVDRCALEEITIMEGRGLHRPEPGNHTTAVRGSRPAKCAARFAITKSPMARRVSTVALA